MQSFLIFLAVVVLGAAIFFVVGRSRPNKVPPKVIERAVNSPDGQALLVGLHEPTPVLPPTLLPEHPRAEDVQNMKLAVGLRGYRADHVDAVIETLTLEIERLHGLLEERDKPPVISATGDSQG